MKRPAINIIQAIEDPNILGDSLSLAQKAGLKALYGLEMTEQESAMAKRCTGRAWAAGREYREAAYICGRRSGKSDKLASNVALYEAFFRDHSLSAGETGVVLLLAQNMRQAKVVKGYIEGKIDRSPVLSRHVVARRAQELELDNGITIAIHPASFRAIRGLSVVSCICDEIAFWWTEDTYANPDVEVVWAVRPSMATFPSAKLLMISSPYTMSGVLWDAWRHRDDDRDTLVWHAPTKLMNPTVTDRFLSKEESRDPENYRREYMSEFTDAVSAFLPSEAIKQCVVNGRTELPPAEGPHRYVCAIDAAYKGDRFTLAIGHYERESEAVVIDVLRSWQGTTDAPLRPKTQVLPEIKALNGLYRFAVVHADQFGAQPLRDIIEAAGLGFEEHPFTNASKGDMYATLRTRIYEQTVELLDHQDSLRELRQLQLELLPGGSTRIGHPGHGKARDDFAGVIALMVSEVSNRLPMVGRAYFAGTIESLRLPT